MNDSAADTQTWTVASSQPRNGAQVRRTTPITLELREPTATGTPAAGKLPTAQARKKAAAILEKEDQDFRDFLAKGQDVVGTLDFTPWYKQAIVGLDMKQTAFNKAEAYLSDGNEPTSLLEKWRDDNGDGNAAITQFAVDGLSPDAPDEKTRKDASDALGALAKADEDAEGIAGSG
ncbi:hypothetical protein [Streptomyces cylindrosporus]|uniref:Uncharacterized protein n=1 Tax=Streptomyces cylindrosporus TaxID=2927583 RepID=A0ABS9YM54_9ACTN|nr:hypothetical protein [Streptomyces cylindrosporus]MCI3277631.1 hypothetical protein [Streptomyces cylindrosporus]